MQKNTKESDNMAELINYKNPEDSPEGALTMRQLIALKKGVRAAIENDDSILSAPGDLTTERWNHAGIGVSIYMHQSGVVVMKSKDDSIVTDADTLDNMSLAKSAFFANPGPAVVSTDEFEED